MEEALDKLEQAAERLAHRQRYDDRNRKALLGIHGVMGVSVGILSLTGGSAQSLIDLFGANSPALTALNICSMVGGATLLVGMALNRNEVLEAFGMAIMLIWDGGMAATLGWAAHVSSLDPEVPHSPTYPVAVYGGLAALMAVHLLTLAQLIVERRGPRGKRA